MTSPENNPGQQPKPPETDPTILALEALKTAVKNKAMADIVEAVKDTATDARDIEIENDKKLDPLNGIPMDADYPGDKNDPDSKKGMAVSVQSAVRNLMVAAMERPPRNIIPGVPANDRIKLDNATRLTRTVLDKMNELINPMLITEDAAPYIHKILFGLLTGEITSIQELSRKYNQIGERLTSINPPLARDIRIAFVKTAMEFSSINKGDADKLFPPKDTSAEDLRRIINNGDMNERKILEVIDRDLFAKNRLKLDKFYSAMKNAETFNAYYTELFDENIQPDKLKILEKKITDRKKNISPTQLTEEVRKLAKEETAKEVHKRIIYLVNLFFKPVLVSAPDQQFAQTVGQYGGAYSPSPENMFRQLTSRISGITTATISKTASDEKIYMAFRQPPKEQIIPDQYTTLSKRNPMKEYEECGFDDFARQMRTIAETEHSFMEYGHNFRFATNKGPQGDKGFFQTIGQYAKESGINTTDIDVITAVEYSELIQIAKIQLERRYKLAFSKMRWQRDIGLFREVFEATNKIDADIRASFIRDFSGDAPDKFPEVIIDRCLAHARTLVYAKEFNLQLWASYADPRLEKGGRPSYSREELSGATSFSPVDDAIRWGIIPDLNNNGELYLPTSGTWDMKNVKEAMERGRKEFYESFTFGWAAFKDAPPTIAEVGNNLTKGGGMDSLGGYRVKQAYEQWMDGLMDERTNNKEINVRTGGDDIMVEAWKRVENVGTNILKNFNEEFVLSEGHKNALKREANPKFTGPKSVTEKYQKLFGFWYDRYLADPDSVGNVYVKGKSKTDYVDKMMKHAISAAGGKDDEFTKEKYRILSVVLFERSPLEFISMEKPRLTQNGVTLMSQIQNSFIKDAESSGKDGALEFDAATNDLVFVEQKARMDSVQQMDEIRKANKLNGDPNNLYGDKKKLRSEVLSMDGWAKNKKGGYVVDEVYIENVLKDQYKNDSEAQRNEKIARAKKMYNRIQEGMKSRPENNNEINIFEAEGETDEKKKKNTAEMRKKLKEKEDKMDVRMDWWADAWKDYKFGMTFTADTADQFMDRSRTGEDTISQATDYCANAAEVMKKHFLVDMKKACKTAALENSFKPLYDYLKEMKSPLDGQDTDLSQKMMVLMTKRIINTMRKDEESMGFMGDYQDALSGRAGSISETYTDEESFKRAWSWDRNDIGDFLEGAKGLTSGKVVDKKHISKLKDFGHAKKSDIFLHHILPLLGLSVGGIMLVSLLQGLNSSGKK